VLVVLPFIFGPVIFFLGVVGDLGGSPAPVPFNFDLEVGGEASNADPFRILPSPPFVVSSAAPLPGGTSECLWVPFTWVKGSGLLEVPFTKKPLPSSCLVSDMTVTLLALLKPQCCPSPISLGLSTATKVARTLLTGRLWIDASERAGDRPRLGGEADRSSECWFSNIARRFLTAPLPELPVLGDMSADRGSDQQKMSLPQMRVRREQSSQFRYCWHVVCVEYQVCAQKSPRMFKGQGCANRNCRTGLEQEKRAQPGAWVAAD
jgi:hypothetical protein